MNPERWKQIDELLDEVFELAPDKRATYLDQACAGNENLRKEVEALLASDERARSFIEAPALQSAADLLSTTPPPSMLQERKLIAGRYEIHSKLGKGGMGEVWHAFDTKLRVDVALKSLRLDLKQSPYFLEALRREVRSAREVISPNVCRLFDVVAEEREELIVMEYVDGITLSAKLMQEGPLQLRNAREIAAQFLAGLQAIHQAGLVHRDFKPENVMITRTGRVVVMDLGIAKQITAVGGTISGTLPYMSPEQIAGKKLDARSDLFSAGVVLAEMIHPEGISNQNAREMIWEAVRYDPKKLADSPWKPIIARAVAANPEHRYSSAEELSRALEEVTQRIGTIEEQKPYPGLASFSTADSEYFFGRELEVETVIKKLNQIHMLALIGPSGAGKTSFLRAGLIPALPQGWRCIFTQPGDAPIVNLAQSLAPIVSGDADAVAKMIQFEEPHVAIWILSRLRQRYSEFLLIVDRFEELFTLNPPETRSRYTEILGRAPVEANIRILLSMRDDFLIFCKQHQPLSPIFSELTAMLPLTGEPLKRALVQPALKCGYRFEDDALVNEIVNDVENERGALPLMAFAASRLWEKRNRQTGVLTREAYREIGGVAGALAQHAENTMERIGTEREPIVREIFRNLITAQNTRAARDTEELLSVFPNRKDAAEVLHELIDARLLTSFESKQENKEPTSRVEIVHESLLSAWPRLVRWQTQDADSAQFRDQLRQAAQMWQQRNRSQDLLWTGAAYLEFQAWRQRYSGGLTSTEEAFAQAMMARANRRRRQQRIAAATIFVILLTILAIISNFWRGEKKARQQSELARKQAISAAQHSEASKLLALAQAESESYPTVALAYAIKSLELNDTPQARMFALKITQQAPLATIMPANQEDGLEAHVVEFSPNGKWIALGGYRRVQIRSSNGEEPLLLNLYASRGFNTCMPLFGGNSDRLFTNLVGDIRILAVPGGKELGRWNLPSGYDSWIVRGENSQFIFTQNGETLTIYSWPNAEIEPVKIGEIPVGPVAVQGTTLFYTDEERKKVQVRSLENWNLPPRIVLNQPENIFGLAINPDGKQFATVEQTGEIAIWDTENRNHPLRILQSSLRFPDWGEALSFEVLLYDPSGDRLAEFGRVEGRPIVFIWDLTAPPGAAPILVHRSYPPYLNGWAFHPSGKWLATANVNDAALWPLPLSFSRSLSIENVQTGSISLVFSPDGQNLFSASSDGTVRSWPLSGRIDQPMSIVLKEKFGPFPRIQFSPEARRFAVSGEVGLVLVANDDGTNLRILKGYSSDAVMGPVAFGGGGRFVAAAVHNGPKADKIIRVWDLESGKVRVVGPVEGAGEGFAGSVIDMKFLDNNQLLVSGDALQLFDLQKNTNKILSNKPTGKFAVSKDRQFLIINECVDATKGPCSFVRIDLKNYQRMGLKSYGQGMSVALNPTDQILVTGSADGLIRVGKVTSEDPHILFGHTGMVDSLAVSPDGRWIASAGRERKIRLTPMPDLSKPAPHTLPHDEFIAKLKTFTNLRAVRDSNSSTGWKLEAGPFPGWEETPGW